QAAELALLVAAVAVGVVARLHPLLMGRLEQVALAAPVAFGRFQHLLMALMSHRATFDARHRDRSFLKMRLNAFAQHSRDALAVALVEFVSGDQIAAARAVFLAHQMVEAGLFPPQLAGGRPGKTLGDGLARFQLNLHDSGRSLSLRQSGSRTAHTLKEAGREFARLREYVRQGRRGGKPRARKAVFWVIRQLGATGQARKRPSDSAPSSSCAPRWTAASRRPRGRRWLPPSYPSGG